MKKIIQEEFQRAFINKRFWIVLLLAAVSFTYGFSQVLEIYQKDSPIGMLTLWQLILSDGSYGFFAALMAGLPFADSLLTDRSHRFIDQILLRVRYRQYMTAKVLAVMCSGMVAVAGPVLILLVVCCLSFKPDPNFTALTLWGINDTVNLNIIEPGTGVVLSEPGFILFGLLMPALFGAVYALLGLGTSFVVRNPFVVLGAPFIVYSVGHFIIHTSMRLSWLGSTEAALLPSSFVSAGLQYLFITLIFIVCTLLWGHKDRMVLD